MKPCTSVTAERRNCHDDFMLMILRLCKCAVWTKMGIHVHVVLLTLLSLSRPLAGCPSSCTCNTTHSDCSSHDLQLSFSSILNQLPSNLTTLNLSRDNISTLYPATFTKLGSLLHLDLSRNQLFTLDPSTFSHLSNLKVLDLSSNVLENLPFNLFSELDGLHVLILRDNRLRELDPRQFRNLTALQHLDLSLNNLASLDSSLLDGVQGLEWLSLAGNKLRMLERQMLEPLAVLRHLLLNGNQWNCSCSLMPFRHWLEWMTYRGGHVDAIECSLPAVLQGRDLRRIPNEMFRHCSQLSFPNHRSPPSCINTSEGRLFSNQAATCFDKRARAMSLRRAPTTMVLARLVCCLVWLMMLAAAMYGCIYAVLAAKHQRELLERQLRVQQQPVMEKKEPETVHEEAEEDEDQRLRTPELTEWFALPPEVCV